VELLLLLLPQADLVLLERVDSGTGFCQEGR
jgi:hypothetical protein